MHVHCEVLSAEAGEVPDGAHTSCLAFFRAAFSRVLWLFESPQWEMRCGISAKCLVQTVQPQGKLALKAVLMTPSLSSAPSGLAAVHQKASYTAC